MKELDKILNYSYSSPEDLYNFINYIMNLSYDELYDLIKNSYIQQEYTKEEYRSLVIKCKIYGNYIKENQIQEEFLIKETESIEKIDKLLNIYYKEEFLTIESFLKKTKLSSDEFSRYLNVLKRKNIKSYQKYIMEKQRREEKLMNNLSEKICQMTFMISTGINDNGDIRPFDIVDYYFLIGLPVKKFLAYLPLVCPSDKRIIITKFLNSYKNEETLETSFLYQLNLRYGCSYNEDGTVIRNSGYLFTVDQKKEVIGYMQKNQDTIPYTEEVYRTLCSRKRRVLEKSVK